MNLSFDLCLLFIFVLVQWRVAILLRKRVDTRFSGKARRIAAAAVWIGSIIPLAGFALSIAAVTAVVHALGPFTLLMGAGALLYFGIMTAGVVLHAVLEFVGRRWNVEADPGRRRILTTTGNLLMAAPVAVLGYGTVVQRTDFQLREIDIALPDLPRDLEGLRILQLSDIHLSAFLSESEFARVVDMGNETRPHVAVVTGDLISGPGDPVDACVRQLGRVKADAGVFGCMGNHEHYARADAYTEQATARIGIPFLRDASRQLRFGSAKLNLVGVDYQTALHKSQYLRGCERHIQPDAVNVLLSHNPDVFPVAARQGYNLLLAGHTHGGQIAIEILDQSINSARFFTPYVYGLYRAGAAAAYVTRGIGTVGIPARIGAVPEIVVVRLRKA